MAEGAIDEEIEVINSIYENAAEFTEESHIVKLQVPESNVKIVLWLPESYPEEAPRIRGVNGLKDDKLVIQKLQSVIDASFVPGEVYLFTFIDEIQNEVKQAEESEQAEHEMNSIGLQENNVKGSAYIDHWACSDDIRDRGSVFVGRAVRVTSEDEMDKMVADLVNDKKISQANHNMIAWRIKISDDLYAQDFDEDGEAGSGPCILHVLKMAEVENVVVVVSRWFGGAHIGPDRFKHIKNCARDALVEGRYIVK